MQVHGKSWCHWGGFWEGGLGAGHSMGEGKGKWSKYFVSDRGTRVHVDVFM